MVTVITVTATTVTEPTSMASAVMQVPISYAWELVTASEWYGISRDNLYVTIFKGEQGIPRDDEAESTGHAATVPVRPVYPSGS